MKAEELRIGNLVGLNLEEYPENFFRMLEIADHTSVVTDLIYGKSKLIDRQYFDSEDLEGIPLTAEWLERFGLTTITENGDGSDNYWSKEKDCSVDMTSYILNDKIDMLFHYRVHERIRVKHLLYVHQLQNLYFALTGSELELKQSVTP